MGNNRRGLSDTVNDKLIVRESLVRAQIPANYWKFRFVDIPDEALYKGAIWTVLTRMHHFNDEDHKWGGWGLFLWGPVGTGKTSIASMLLKGGIARGGRSLFIDSN